MTGEQREALQRAVELYNVGEYLDSQEALEDLHNACAAEDQALVKALAMLACGMHIHFHRGGGRGVLNLLRQSLIILDDLRPDCEEIGTGELYDNLFAYVEELQGRTKRGAGFFDRWLVPKVPLV